MTYTSNPSICWICGSSFLRLIKTANLPKHVTPDTVRITDAEYGRTAAIYQCADCGFRQCSEFEDALALYECMDDEEYDLTRDSRAIQARQLLKKLATVRQPGRLLDVGAGTGIMVEQANALGYSATGVEPSRPLQARAVSRGLSVKLGVLPHPDTCGPYDTVTLIDVIEHVSAPIELLKEIERVLSPDGICAIVTPDVGSLAARLLGNRWWHYRVAHIGYFDKNTLRRAADLAGFEIQMFHRPSWYFPADYLAQRALSYSPKKLRPPVPSWLNHVLIPLNLFDSILAICAKRCD